MSLARLRPKVSRSRGEFFSRSNLLSTPVTSGITSRVHDTVCSCDQVGGRLCVQAYLEGVAKNLVDRLYGPQGPAWGTKMTELEDVVVAVRATLRKKCWPTLWSDRRKRLLSAPWPIDPVPVAGGRWNQRRTRNPHRADARGRGSLVGATRLLPQMSAVFFFLSRRAWGLIGASIVRVCWTRSFMQESVMDRTSKHAEFAEVVGDCGIAETGRAGEQTHR